MTKFSVDTEKFGRLVILGLALIMLVTFLWMIRHQVIALLMGAILAGLTMPVYNKLLGVTRGRGNIAAILTVCLLLLVIIIPTLGLLGIVAGQALEVSESVGPWLQQNVMGTTELRELLDKIPFADKLAPYRDQITAKLAEFTGAVGQFTVNVLAGATRDTAAFFFNLFITLYASFFYLRHGKGTLNRILYYLPLKSGDEDRLVKRFLSVARATLKGTLVIAVAQGALGAAGLALMGIQGSIFLGAVIAVLSLIPAIGASLVWVPVTIYLVAVGRIGGAIFIVVWFSAVVGTADNILRPRLVGKDTEMSDLVVLVSTIGGLASFGMIGLFLGPILAALFDTVWTIYGEAYKEILPPRPVTEAEE